MAGIKPEGYAGTGRPTDMTPETIAKLEEVFAIGGSDEEACFYADIGKTTLYNYQQRNPEFVTRKEALRERPILKARQTVVKALDNPEMAFKYLERKRKNEFSTRQEITGSDGRDLIQLDPKKVAIAEEYERKLKEGL